MRKHRKLFHTLLALTNVFIAVTALRIAWRFHHEWVKDGGLSKIDVEHKDQLLRNQFYGWLPVVGGWGIISGVMIWHLRKD